MSANAQLRLSREQFAVTLTSIGDGVITTDAERRVTFLNPEAERLTGWTRDEAERQQLVSIFPIFNEDTREPVCDPAKKVLELGMTVGLANHTVLISRNGKEIPIADSGAPIRDVEGKMLGVVLVFRDCTMEREKESALRERVVAAGTTRASGGFRAGRDLFVRAKKRRILLLPLQQRGD